MNLLQAFELEFLPATQHLCLAFVGAGGKTSAMFQLARLLLQQKQFHTILVSTTTHLGVQELSLADHTWIIENESDWHSFEAHHPEGLVFVCGPTLPNDRVEGLPDHLLERLNGLAITWQVPLFLEADGSRRKPLKAPAEHEPALPGFITGVVVVAGLSALGGKLDDSVVHRPELFAALSGLAPGDSITPHAMVKVLTHPQGGLKSIPPQADRWLLLNQADSLTDLAIIEPLIDAALEMYPRVILASLRSQKVLALYEQIAGVVLAAGAAERFGSPKQLALWQGQTLLAHVAQKALAGGLSPVRVITGAYSDQVRTSLQSLPESVLSKIELIYNSAWKSGLSSSLRAGLQDLPSSVSGAVFLLADQPHIPVELIRGLRQKRAQERSWAVVPRFKGQRVNPVLFGKELFSKLASLQGDAGGRQLLREPVSFSLSWLDWEASADRLDLDIDLPEDIQALADLDLP